MSNAANQDKFANRLDNLIDMARTEGELSVCEVIGILEMKKLCLFEECIEDES